MNQVQMAAKLCDIRDTLRRLFGETKFAEKVAGCRPHLEKEAELHNGEVLPAMIAMVDRLQNSGKDVGISCELLMATAVEMLEG